MTAIIGFCRENGAFLAADSARMNVDSGQLEKAPVKKIECLRDGILIATGGLGTIGHQARDELISAVQLDNQTTSAVVEKAIEIFSAAYAQSLILVPGHKIPLTCILAGRDDEGKGFICALGSAQSFKPLWIKTVGQPYFTGSNTNLVIQEASIVIHELKSSNEKFHLDEWAIRSMDRISKLDGSVQFPLQLASVTDQTLNLFPVHREHAHVTGFSTAFPQL
ncbi:hypothetical protein [Thermomonas sp. XSG]|uniref:hypothetical protein n=1 Tax=Thermomonas sp. XSG TaxID=2771436 RepID=UPI001680ABEE|nr:hypothetical protein [Thermomonas sp. XSG]QNU14360.1 hypothetical protein ICG51_000589 [Thermomonas sp. XSG]